MASQSSDDKINTFLNIETVNDDFFNEIVERKMKITRDKFKIRLVFIMPATGKNENYVSVVYRAKISVELLETNEKVFVNAIIKALITTIPELKEFGVFPRERYMFEEIIESFEDIWRDVGGETVIFGPGCLAIHSDPYEIIVLDDLKAEGFEVLDRKVGVNLDQAKAVMKTLAKFHAAGAVRYQKDGMIKSILDRNLSVPRFPKDGPLGKACKKFFDAFFDGVKDLNVSDSCVGKIARWDPTELLDASFRGCIPMKSGFTVLNHGDDWINNMMFKLDEDGNTVDFRLLDFQMSFWGSPVADLFYFLMSSVKDDVKVAHFDEIIAYYHEQLVEALEKLKYDKHIPTLEELKEEMMEKKELGMKLSNLHHHLLILFF
ncbi:unnamed protein product [Chironomus riparius]|uniref:CHK kinase-like domain-containing protein n=1 Tax=Chironomus riparius TaxID=315576 RepID=A0A9N9S7F9_9DIPT|nr:unnamed protein product [Chironomus riparius]